MKERLTQSLIWGVYNILFFAGYSLLMPKYLIRMWRRGGYRKDFLQRMGWYDAGVRGRLTAGKRVWVHAVSVGEVQVAIRVMEALRKRRPELSFVLSTTTSTGHAVAEPRMTADDVLIYYPADFPGVVRRALEAIQPVALILTEGEIWPNMIRALGRRGIPVWWMNGRISAGSYRGYRWLGAFMCRVLEGIGLFLMQGETDAARLKSLRGGLESGLHILGSVKHDLALPPEERASAARADLTRWGVAASARILVGGSTWPGEEDILLDLYLHLHPDFPDLRLVLVPRHAERRAEIIQAIERRQLPCIQKTRQALIPEKPPEVILVDTTGELLAYYAQATVVFVGKSLCSHGGQNFLEPALFGKPVIVGPNLENFPDIADAFLAADAMVRVRDAAELEREVRLFLQDPERCAAYGERARQELLRSRGAADRTAELLLQAMDRQLVTVTR